MAGRRHPATGTFPLDPDNHHAEGIADPDPQHVDNTWTGQGDGTSWTDANNWSLGHLPTAQEDAIIDVPNADPTITISYDSGTGQSSFFVNSLQVAEHLVLQYATLNIAAASEITGSLSIEPYSILTGSGDVTISGSLNWTGGEMSGTGTTTITAAGQLHLTPGGGSPAVLGHNLVNAGTVLWTGGGKLSLSQGHALTNAAGGRIEIGAGVTLARDTYSSTGTESFQNEGTLVHNAANGGSSFEVLLGTRTPA